MEFSQNKQNRTSNRPPLTIAFITRLSSEHQIPNIHNPPPYSIRSWNMSFVIKQDCMDLNKTTTRAQKDNFPTFHNPEI